MKTITIELERDYDDENILNALGEADIHGRIIEPEQSATNQDRAAREVASWPRWKRDVMLTKYSQLEQSASGEGEVTDAMAFAFHRAITDGAIGESEVEEIKAGLRAVFGNHISQPDWNTFISVPKNEQQAEAMQKLGYAWLEQNAPHRLTPLASEIATLRKHNEELIFSVAAVLKCWYEDAGDVVRMTPKMDHLKLVRRRIEDATPSLPDSGGDKNDDKAQLNKLLYAVASKFPNETRFETALRYIRQAERGDNCNVAATAIPLPKGDKK